jgi:hypothetical protein
MRDTVLKMMIFVRFTVLGEAMVLVETSVIVEATSLERMYIGAKVLEATVLIRATALKATVPVEIYGIIGATVLCATVLVEATVLGGRYRKCG